MLKIILLFTFIQIFVPTLSLYLPMSTRTISLDPDICSITIDGNTYVKGCESGKTCKPLSYQSMSVCVNVLVSKFKKVGSDCYQDSDCNTGLECYYSKCALDSYYAYHVNDVYGNSYYYCEDGKLYDKTNLRCSYTTNYCYNSNSGNSYYPGFLSVCGKMDIYQSYYGNSYSHSSTEIAEIGSVEDGQFVEDELACSSGFSLQFFTNKKTYNYYDNTLFKMCVTLVDVYDNGYIKYRIGSDEDQIYNLTSSEVITLKTKVAMFQKYKEALNSEKDNIKKELNYEEPMTYGKDSLRKWYYLYNNPDLYLIYKNEPEVIDYLIQQKYPDYIVNSYDKSSYLDFKYILLILFIIML